MVFFICFFNGIRRTYPALRQNGENCSTCSLARWRRWSQSASRPASLTWMEMSRRLERWTTNRTQRTWNKKNTRITSESAHFTRFRFISASSFLSIHILSFEFISQDFEWNKKRRSYEGVYKTMVKVKGDLSPHQTIMVMTAMMIIVSHQLFVPWYYKVPQSLLSPKVRIP